MQLEEMECIQKHALVQARKYVRILVGGGESLLSPLKLRAYPPIIIPNNVFLSNALIRQIYKPFFVKYYKICKILQS